MRTTIRLDDALLREAKASAARSGRSLNAFFEEAASARLQREKATRGQARTRLHTFKGRGVLPGVDLGDGAALRDLMERGRDAL